VAENRSQTRGRDGPKKPPGLETARRIVLSVSPNEEDRASLERIVKSDWTVIAFPTVASALSVVKETPIPIVICDCDITPRTWVEMLDHISFLPNSPLLILASRLADERLWAEALNLGAWDVLAKPFDADEVIRIVGVAWQHWRDCHRANAGRAKPSAFAMGAEPMAATGT
jgi:DNA-binding NtrC family response regulator